MIIAPIKEWFKITQTFWKRPEVYGQFWMKGHNGCDYATPEWTEVYASFDWQVAINDSWKKWYWLHSRLTEVWYWILRQVVLWHLSEIKIKEWDKVKAWELLWYTWSTWFSSWPHLHFWLRRIDPSGSVINYNNWYYGYEDIFQKKWLLAYTPSSY